jgi:photosystem II stability/assembly factor-like uncharacterized protein
MHFFDASNGLCSGGFTKTLVTTDGGSTWTISTAQGVRDFSFINSTVGYGASITGQSLVKTTNAAASFTSLTPPSSNSQWSVAATDATTAYFGGTNAEIWKTTNSGANFSILTTGINTNFVISDIVFTSATNGCFVASNGIIKQTINSGATWTTVYTAGSGKSLTEICFVDQNTGYAVGSNGIVVKTTDGGATWTLQTTGSSGLLQGVHFIDANNGVAVGIPGVIIHTTDGGATWNAETSGTTEELYDVRMLSTEKAIVCGNNGLILQTAHLTTAVEESLNTQTSFYPNPVKEQLMITTVPLIYSLRVTDLTGNIVLTADNINTNKYILNCTELKAGDYIVTLTTAGGQLSRKITK